MERKDGGGREAGSLVRGSNGGSGKDAAPSVVDDDRRLGSVKNMKDKKKRRKQTAGVKTNQEKGALDVSGGGQRVLKLVKKIEKAKGLKKKQKLMKKLQKMADKADDGPSHATSPTLLGPTPRIDFQPITLPPLGALTTSLAQRETRRQRFLTQCPPASASTSTVTLGGTVKYGTSSSLEKEYLRLTSRPRVEDVRPPEVLEAALKLVKARWVEGVEYAYVCEQLKSIRQDLVVQHVRSQFAVEVYETHARLALENSDMEEYKQCDTVLKSLYEEGVGGNEGEFWAYSVLFSLPSTSHAVSYTLCKVPPHLLDDPGLRHALQVLRAYRTQNYHLFVQLYNSAPRMSPYLMDRLLPRMRHSGLRAMVTAYYPGTIPLSMIASELGYDGITGVKGDLATWGLDQAVEASGRILDTKAARCIIRRGAS